MICRARATPICPGRYGRPSRSSSPSVGRHPLDDQIDGRDLVEQQVEPLLRRAPDQLEATGPHPQRRMRLLHGARLDDDVVEVPALAVVREAVAGGPGLAQERQGLVEALGRLLDGDAEARELRRAVALADAEIEAAVGQQIQRGDLLGQQHGVVPGQHHHRGAQPYALGAAGKVAQEIERRRELPHAREVVLDHEHAVIAELLGVAARSRCTCDSRDCLRPTPRPPTWLRRTARTSCALSPRGAEAMSLPRQPRNHALWK